MKGERPPSVEKVTQFIADRIDKEKLYEDIFIKF